MIFGRNRKVRHEQVSLPEELLEERDHEVAAVPEAAETGPHDVATRPDPSGTIDLGSLRVRAVPGMKLRLDVEDATKRIVAATVNLGRSALQVQAFSAPRRTGLWDDLREELRDSLATTPNATVQEQRGRFGAEILTRVPAALADGSPGWNVARFVGVDGPRWFVRGVFHGEAAFQPEAAEQLEQVFSDIVVVRGDEPLPPRELLPLRPPANARPVQRRRPGAPAAAAPDAGRDVLADTERSPQGDPAPAGTPMPERGPEITEIR